MKVNEPCALLIPCVLGFENWESGFVVPYLRFKQPFDSCWMCPSVTGVPPLQIKAAAHFLSADTVSPKICLQSVFLQPLLFASCQRTFPGSVAHPARHLCVSWTSSYVTTKIIWWPPEMWITELPKGASDLAEIKLHISFGALPVFSLSWWICQICWLFETFFRCNIKQYHRLQKCHTVHKSDFRRESSGCSFWQMYVNFT